jgi:hypothetical protein
MEILRSCSTGYTITMFLQDSASVTGISRLPHQQPPSCRRPAYHRTWKLLDLTGSTRWELLYCRLQ